MLNPAKKVALPPPSIADFTPNPHPEVLGRNVRMKFDNEKGQVQWYDGIIVSYNGQTRKYGVFFPCDQQTVETYLDDEDTKICN